MWKCVTPLLAAAVVLLEKTVECRPLTGHSSSNGLNKFNLLHSSKHSYPIGERLKSRMKLEEELGGSLLDNCTEYWFTQYLDHFNWRTADGSNQNTYQQRYFICGGAKWTPNDPDSPIFFYTGNEADVELYINNTGLMWQNADALKALMVFAEHRYFGKSLPFGTNDADLEDQNLVFLNADQALADYATLLGYLLATYAESENGLESVTPVIGFGGSYGGMLCSWFRMKYPQYIDGCIAGSAPILAFEGLNPPVNDDFFAEIETYDCMGASGGGVSDDCAMNYNQSWDVIFDLSETAAGRTELADIFRLCTVPETEAEAQYIASWVNNALGNMAMSEYPFASGYLLNGDGILPAYPLRKGCLDYLNSYITDDSSRLEAVREAVAIYYNYSQSLECFDMSAGSNEETNIVGLLWNYLYCTEIFMPFGQHQNDKDMLWDDPWDPSITSYYCKLQYKNAGPRQFWAANNFGGWNSLMSTASNIVFSNGELDPWRGGGVTGYNDTSRSIYSVIVSQAGHHMDLMFSTEEDSLTNVQTVRDFEMAMISQWISDKKIRTQQRRHLKKDI